MSFNIHTDQSSKRNQKTSKAQLNKENQNMKLMIFPITKCSHYLFVRNHLKKSKPFLNWPRISRLIHKVRSDIFILCIFLE
jgi:hypothetical protein